MTVLPAGFAPVPSAPLPGAEALPRGLSAEPAPDQASFANVIQGFLQRANEPSAQADAALQGLITGKTENLHDVVLSVVKADMSFRLLLELRNRLTEAYQEVMRMQV